MTAIYHSLASGSLLQDWSNAGLITVNDDWSGVPSIVGYRGDELTAATGADPQTLLADGVPVIDVNVNQTSPNTFNTGGVAEFAIANPTVALNGSGTADAPSLVFHVDATGRQDVRVQFNVRDLDGSVDNAIQQVALQYRIGETGAWTNLPAGFVADATQGPSLSGQSISVDVTLPGDANNQAQVQVRVITANAVGNDEWVGIDDIDISSAPGAGDTTAPTLVSSSPADNAINVAAGADIVLNFSEAVQLGSGEITVTDGAGDVRTITLGAADPDGTVTVNGSQITIDLAGDLAFGPSYDVLVGAGAVEDLAGNDFAGLAADALDFSTAAANITILAAAQSLQGSVATPVATDEIGLVRLGAFTPAAGNAEVVAYDAASHQFYSMNAIANTLDIVRIESTGGLTATGSINLAALTDFGGANSVAIKNGVMAVAYGSATPGAPGHVALLDL